jgi:hypothetical protein
MAAATYCGSAAAGQSPSGWKWDAPPAPAAAPQRPEPLQAPKPACDPKNAGSPECAAAATTGDDGLENTLAPPSQMTTSGNRRAKKASN